MGFMNNDSELIGRSLEDVIIEPIRSILIPGFDEINESCKEAGSLGGGISGSGPSIFMVNKTEETALKVEKIMSGIYEKIGVDFKTYVTSINTTGVKIVE
jgi:homoserine kinase